MNRNELDIVFLDDRYDVGFITGDQPVVNLLGPGDGRQTTELALFYPVSPDISCLVVPRNYEVHSAVIPGNVIEELNALVAWESENFLIAKSNKRLQTIVSGSSSTRPSGRKILESVVKASRSTISGYT
ncbi:MAG: DUF4238 domain-containing protein [Chloroflexi bacterium]|nr:DUF4238 domain-containing protein [Chloroflexota bacterium]